MEPFSWRLVNDAKRGSVKVSLGSKRGGREFPEYGNEEQVVLGLRVLLLHR